MNEDEIIYGLQNDGKTNGDILGLIKVNLGIVIKVSETPMTAGLVGTKANAGKVFGTGEVLFSVPIRNKDETYIGYGVGRT